MKCALKKSSLIFCAFLWGKKAFVLKTIQSGVVFIRGKKRNYIRHYSRNTKKGKKKRDRKGRSQRDIMKSR